MEKFREKNAAKFREKIMQILKTETETKIDSE